MSETPGDEFDRITERLDIPLPEFDVNSYNSLTEQDFVIYANEQDKLYAADFVNDIVITNFGESIGRVVQIDMCALGPVCLVEIDDAEPFRIVIIGSLLQSLAMSIKGTPNSMMSRVCNLAVEEKQETGEVEGMLYHFLPHGFMTNSNLCYSKVYTVDELIDIEPQRYTPQGGIIGGFTLVDTEGGSSESVYAVSQSVTIANNPTEFFECIDNLHREIGRDS